LEVILRWLLQQNTWRLAFFLERFDYCPFSIHFPGGLVFAIQVGELQNGWVPLAADFTRMVKIIWLRAIATPIFSKIGRELTRS
jgi:hypothetical protein